LPVRISSAARRAARARQRFLDAQDVVHFAARELAEIRAAMAVQFDDAFRGEQLQRFANRGRG
jgi:hypothetical protein